MDVRDADFTTKETHLVRSEFYDLFQKIRRLNAMIGGLVEFRFQSETRAV